jgi:hypothetical protein
MPDEGHPLYPGLESATWKIFDRFAHNGRLEIRGETELTIGQIMNDKKYRMFITFMEV